MKVALHVGQLLQPVPGGIGRYVRGLLEALPAAGAELVPFAAGPRPPECGPRYRDLGRPRGRWRYQAWHRLRRPRVDLGTDVVHAPSLAVPPATPLVVTVHDLAFRRLPEAFTSSGRAFHERGLALARAEARAIVVPSRFTHDELVAEGFVADRLHIAHHGADVIDREPDNDAVAARVAAAGIDEPYVLAVGTVEPRKGFDTLAAAVGRARDQQPITLAIAGPPGWGDVPGLDADCVARLGAIDPVLLDSLYRRAVACCVPSTYEGFGLPALEAMARGCPVVASDTASLPEVVGDAGVLVPPGDVEAWTQAVASLATKPEQRAALAARGRRRAATFTWEASATAHLAAYRAALQ